MQVRGRTIDLTQVRSTPLTYRCMSYCKDDGCGERVRRHAGFRGRIRGIYPSGRAPTPSRDDRGRASAQGLNQQTLSGYGGRPNPLAGTRFDTNTTAVLRREASEKELHEVRSHLGDAQRLLKEARVRARKMDDRLLQAVKALESARAELPRQSVVKYKESLGFKEGLKRMGRVTYEYGYRVALARFHARHPDAEVEEDPFTIHPEDDLVSMERQQAFNDLVPPEP
ncbi:hypothetical protein B296_00034930 [Ensete ventricosum]|uniref:Uncharacterized protein n=1 Tax=Ensete ventricosum TaxID=4639 RepID=A0A426Z015_ENSVE|nr:hypothetical protein B296_00034930 [Ensete ventricosum]